MDIWHRVGRIVRFSNLGTLLFFTLNILLIVAVFGSSGSIVELICIYFFTVAISLSPLGEMCLAAFAGASDIWHLYRVRMYRSGSHSSLQIQRDRSFSALFKSKDLLSDKLKSCKDLDQFYTIPLGDCICKIGCNNCLDQCTVLRKASVYGFALADLIVCKKASGHVSCQVMIFSVFVF